MPRRDAPARPPVVFTIAGSDSGGGAGIQADLQTIAAGGAFGTSAVTSVTAQHTRGVESTHLLPVGEIAAQVDAVLGDFDVDAVKTGMLGTSEAVETVTDYAPDLPRLVVDPVMVAASGDRLLEPDAEAAYADLVAEAALVTPNADEAAVLTDVTVTDEESAREAGRALVETGADAALVKGGHVPGDAVVDVLVTDDAVRTFRHDRVDTEATHGSGCALSSAVATRLAHGDDLPTAVAEGISLLGTAVRYNVDVGEGPGAVHPLVGVRDDAAAGETLAAVERVVDELADGFGRDSPVRTADALVPETGTNVVGATPYAETPADVAGVEGGLGWTGTGLRANRGARFGVADRLAAVVLGVRERAPDVRFALEVRRDEAVVDALADLPGETVTLSDPGETATLPDDEAGESAEAAVRRAAVRQAAVRQAVDDLDDVPVAVVGTGEAGGRVAVLAPDADELLDRLDRLARTVA